MSQVISVDLSICVAASFEDDKLIYIGSFKSEIGIQKGVARHITRKEYYIPRNSATWSSAASVCSHLQGFNGTLVAIESEEEWRFLAEVLDNYGFEITYWTSGKYDRERSLWIWLANDEPLPPFAPVFPSDPSQIHRVIIDFINRYNVFMITAPNTQLHRFICELRKL